MTASTSTRPEVRHSPRKDATPADKQNEPETTIKDALLSKLGAFQVTNPFAEDAQPTNPSLDKNVSTYLPHLDGVRAIALLGVLLFHFELFNTTGGFTGVDVFLVLSGFLMTRLILRDIDSKSFSMVSFCTRRFWRLYPSCVTVVAITLMLSLCIQLSEEAARTARSAMGALTFSSNFVFYKESGYFDANSATKPLLHTWSLGLEEQFYIVWPIILGAISFVQRPTGRLIGLVCVLLLSVYAARLEPDDSARFFMLPGRVAEFAVGAVTSMMYAKLSAMHVGLQQFLSIVGLLLIGQGFFYMSEATPYPSVLYLAPLLGSVFLIITPASWIARYMLSLKPMRWLGAISYSAYLVHWPIWVLYGSALSVIGSDGLPSRGRVILGTFVSAHLLNIFVERPLRHKKTRPMFALPVIALVFVCTMFTASHYMKATEAARYGMLHEVGDTFAHWDEKKEKFVEQSKDEDKRNGFLEWYGGISPEGTLPEVMFIGTSFASHLIRGVGRVPGVRAAGASWTPGCVRIPEPNRNSWYDLLKRRPDLFKACFPGVRAGTQTSCERPKVCLDREASRDLLLSRMSRLKAEDRPVIVVTHRWEVAWPKITNETLPTVSSYFKEVSKDIVGRGFRLLIGTFAVDTTCLKSL